MLIACNSTESMYCQSTSVQNRVKRTYGLIEKNVELTTSSRDAQLSARFLSELMVQKPQSCEKGHVTRVFEHH